MSGIRNLVYLATITAHIKYQRYFILPLPSSLLVIQGHKQTNKLQSLNAKIFMLPQVELS